MRRDLYTQTNKSLVTT